LQDLGHVIKVAITNPDKPKERAVKKKEMKLILTLFAILLSVVFHSCYPTKILSGKYRSFAYSKTQIFYNVEFDFKPDSTFDFRMAFDLMGDHAKGSYDVRGRYIHLKYDIEKPDTSIANLLSLRNKNGRMPCLYVSGNKLFPCDSTGQVKMVYADGSRYFFKKGRLFN
jgi:hypothetical protein